MHRWNKKKNCPTCNYICNDEDDGTTVLCLDNTVKIIPNVPVPT
jgi:hypothetical protein